MTELENFIAMLKRAKIKYDHGNGEYFNTISIKGGWNVSTLWIFDKNGKLLKIGSIK